MKNANAAQIRAQVEGALASRIPSALTPQERLERELAPTGIDAVDAMLGGGFPVGAITEIVGSLGSGRATYAQSFVARRTGEGYVCAWVDVADSFDPKSAAANQIDLERLLWVRCGGEAPRSQRAARGQAQASQVEAPVIGGGGGSPHPRAESRGLSDAVGSFLKSDIAAKALPSLRRDKSIGTPGVANRRLYEASREGKLDRTEQVAYDRLPARRGAYVLSHRAQAGTTVRELSSPPTAAEVPSPATGNVARQSTPWREMDQAIKAADLILQTGGFAVLVLDMGTVAPAVVNRIPLATWFRFRAGAERTRTSIVLLTQHPCAQTSAELVLRTSMELPQAGTVLTGLSYSTEIIRQRLKPADKVVPLRKAPQRASTVTWQATSAWVGGW